MVKKSLSDKILELSQPTTSFDIESHDLQEGHSDDSDRRSDDSGSDDDHAREHYVSTGKSKLRNDGIQISLKYGGKPSSRNDLYGDSDSEDAQERSESESRESDEDSEIDDDDQEGASLEDQNLEDVADENHNGSASEDSPEGGSSVSESSEDDSDELDGGFSRKYDKSKVKELLSREQKHLVGRMSQSAVNDALKGYAITRQNKLFDSILNLRMKVQKATTNANLLPVNSSIMKDYATKKSEDKIADAEEACYDLLDTLFDLRKTLMKKDSVACDEELKKVKSSRKRKLSDYMGVATSYDSLLEKYRSSVLTKWSAKIHNTSGSSAITAGKFKSFNQSAEQQVKNNLTDMDRLVKKTKLNRRQILPLGYESILNQATIEDDGEESDPDIPKQSSSDHKTRTAEIDHIFDDEDFYRTLLNDLIDKKIQNSNATSGLTIALKSLQLAQKMKKNVDTKASKGRKLRYNIQEPIANFEVPRGSWKWDDYQIDEFFASLLGHKINMNESESEPESSSDENEIVENGEESIKLFG